MSLIHESAHQGGRVGGGAGGAAAGVKLLEAVLGHVGGRGPLAAGHAGQFVRVAQGQIVVDQHLQEQQPAVAVA